MTSDTPGVAAVVDSPLTFGSAFSNKNITWDPVSPGSAVLTIETPAGFGTAADPDRKRTVTVSP